VSGRGPSTTRRFWPTRPSRRTWPAGRPKASRRGCTRVRCR
jgi:hypothetical protein